MSVFGPTDDGDYRRWQQRNLKAVTELITLGVKKKLPPIAWRVPTIGTLTGTVENHADHHPREVFEAWHIALTDHQRIDPRGLGLDGDGPPRRERTFDTGQTRMTAVWDLRFTSDRHPHCDFVIVAEWYEDELTQNTADGAKQHAS